MMNTFGSIEVYGLGAVDRSTTDVGLVSGDFVPGTG